MVEKVDTATVKLWGDDVGVVSWEEGFAAFEYANSFLKKGLDISPLHMSIEQARRSREAFRFAHLARKQSWAAFRGLPGLLADALPDNFGNRVIDSWLARKGRDIESFTPLERLCYIGTRGMGALEFHPSIAPSNLNKTIEVEVADLVNLARKITQERFALDANLNGVEKEDTEAIMDILRVGTSAGGNRPKAVIAINDDGHVISGQGTAPDGYDHYVMKFDGVDTQGGLGTPEGYGRIEYAYHLMARAAGIEMTNCHLLEEGGRAHFLTKRFDREGERKIHMQSLCGLAHFDFNSPGDYSYERAFQVMRQLRLPKKEAVQQYRRMIFNVIARNQDDHTKNIGFLMDPSGTWRLSPAYDVTFAYQPDGAWTNQHQMTINGKRDDFTMADLIAVGESINISKSAEIIEEIIDCVSRWEDFAKEADVSTDRIRKIREAHRLHLETGPGQSPDDDFGIKM